MKPDILKQMAREIRSHVLGMSHKARTPHLGSALSCVDLLVAAYWTYLKIDPADPLREDRDRFILSKGHAAAALYATLAVKGFFPLDLLQGFAQPGNPLSEQPAPGAVPGVEFATGSLGHGLPVACGLAMASKLQSRPYRVLAILSDGECNEGSTWEAALFAPAHGLENLTVMIDFNKWQATGRSQEIMALDPFVEKWQSFGWQASELDGHDLEALAGALSSESRKPKAIIAHTVKGKGVSFMEDDNNWHYRIPNEAELALALQEIATS